MLCVYVYVCVYVVILCVRTRDSPRTAVALSNGMDSRSRIGGFVGSSLWNRIAVLLCADLDR